MAKWNFRIVQLDYDDGTTRYSVQTDKGEGDDWTSVFSSPELVKARDVKAEREARNKSAKLTVVE